MPVGNAELIQNDCHCGGTCDSCRTSNEYIGFAALKKQLAEKGDVDDPAAVAAAIGRKKYGAKGMARKAARGRAENQLTQNDANFVSESQRKFMWSQHPEIAESWAHGEHTSEGPRHNMPGGPGPSVKGPMARAARARKKRGAKVKNQQTRVRTVATIQDDSRRSVWNRLFDWLLGGPPPTRNANPEGRNQFTGGGSAMAATKQALAASKAAGGEDSRGTIMALRAHAASTRGNSEQAAGYHQHAKVAHEMAAERETGPERGYHLKAAEAHGHALAAHGGVANARRHQGTGRFIAPDAGDGRGPAHDAATAGAAIRDDYDDEDDDQGDDDGQVENAWTDAARAAAVEARKKSALANETTRRSIAGVGAKGKHGPGIKDYLRRADVTTKGPFAAGEIDVGTKAQHQLAVDHHEKMAEYHGNRGETGAATAHDNAAQAHREVMGMIHNARTNQAQDPTAPAAPLGPPGSRGSGTDVDALRRGPAASAPDPTGHDDDDEDDEIIPGRQDEPAMPTGATTRQASGGGDEPTYTRGAYATRNANPRGINQYTGGGGGRKSVGKQIADEHLKEHGGDKVKAARAVKETLDKMSNDNANKWHWQQAHEHLTKNSLGSPAMNPSVHAMSEQALGASHITGHADGIGHAERAHEKSGDGDHHGAAIAHLRAAGEHADETGDDHSHAEMMHRQAAISHTNVAGDFVGNDADGDDDDDGDGKCPKCGGEMEDGKCEDCGYTENQRATQNRSRAAGSSAGATTPSGGSNMDRNRTIEYIVTNGAAWQGQRQTLAQLPDATLNAIAQGVRDGIVANSARAGFRLPPGAAPGTYVYNAEGKLVRNDGGIAAADGAGNGHGKTKQAGGEEDGDDDDGNMFESDPGKGLKNPKTFNQFMKGAPPEVREAVLRSMKTNANDRQLLINRLTAHIIDPNRKARLVANYSRWTVEQLQDAAADLPTVNVGGDFEIADLNFLGAAGGPMLVNQSAEDQSDVLQPPTINYQKIQEEEREKRRQKSA